MSEKLYQQAGATGQAGPDMGGGFQGGPGPDMGGGFQGGPGPDMGGGPQGNVYDADYEVMDDDNK